MILQIMVDQIYQHIQYPIIMLMYGKILLNMVLQPQDYIPIPQEVIDMIAIANYLYSIVYSDVYGKEDWRNWADQLIISHDNLDVWIYDLSMARNKEQVFEALFEQMHYERIEIGLSYPLTEIIQGYYYYKYINKEILLYQLLTDAGTVADAGQDSKMSCEYFYSKLNQIDIDKTIANKENFITEITSYFLPLYREAMYQKSIIESITLEDIISE